MISTDIDLHPPIRLMTLSSFTLQMAGDPAILVLILLDTVVTFQGCLDILNVYDATQQRDYVCKLHVKRHVVRRDTTCKAGPGCRDT